MTVAEPRGIARCHAAPLELTEIWFRFGSYKQVAPLELENPS